MSLLFSESSIFVDEPASNLQAQLMFFSLAYKLLLRTFSLVCRDYERGCDRYIVPGPGRYRGSGKLKYA